MIYITKIELENFQSHGHTVMEFDRGLNVILGNSDSGKTAILRAIKWTLYNEPLGDYFIRQGEKKVAVTITFNTGTEIRRMRSSSKNSYYLKQADGEEFTFEGFGTSVPKEIIDAMGMYKIHLDNESTSIINIGQQLDGPFLLNEKPSLRASAIGRLIGVNYIDDALRDVVRDNKRLNQDLRSLLEQKETLEKKISEFDYLQDLENRYKTLLEIRKMIEHKQIRRSSFEEFKKKYSGIFLEEGNLRNYLNDFQGMDKLESHLFRLEKLIYRHRRLCSLKADLESNTKSLDSTKSQYEKVKNIGFLEESIHQISSKYSIYKKKEMFYTRLQYHENEITKTEEKLYQLKNLEEWDRVHGKLMKKIESHSHYSKWLEQYNTIEKNLKIGSGYVKEFKHLDGIEDLANRLLWKTRTLKLLKSFAQRYHEISLSGDEERESIRKLISEIDILSVQYGKLIEEIRICPFCYSEITTESLAHIKTHLRGDTQ